MRRLNAYGPSSGGRALPATSRADAPAVVARFLVTKPCVGRARCKGRGAISHATCSKSADASRRAGKNPGVAATVAHMVAELHEAAVVTNGTIGREEAAQIMVLANAFEIDGENARGDIYAASDWSMGVAGCIIWATRASPRRAKTATGG